MIHICNYRNVWICLYDVSLVFLLIMVYCVEILLLILWVLNFVIHFCLILFLNNELIHSKWDRNSEFSVYDLILFLRVKSTVWEWNELCCCFVFISTNKSSSIFVILFQVEFMSNGNVLLFFILYSLIGFDQSE